MAFTSFANPARAAVIGASGGVGAAFVEALVADPAVETVYALSRSGAAAPGARALSIDITEEASIAAAAAAMGAEGALDCVIVATGLLHDGEAVQPEKTFKALSAEAMMRVYAVNAVGPALVAKHLLPLLAADRKAVFATLAARVGSIEDNRLGGWHAYRASKAALVQLVRTLSIELGRTRPQAVCVALHPGTVDTGLSQPFQRGVPDDKLFTPARSVGAMLSVIDTLTPGDTGRQFAYDGAPVPF